MQYKNKDEYVDAIQLKAPMSIRRASNQNDDFGEIGDWLVITDGESKFMSNDEFQSKYQAPVHTGIYPYTGLYGLGGPTIACSGV